MKNRDAINLLEEVKMIDDTMYAYNPVYVEALDMALTALEAEETWYATHEYPPKQRWIPVSERLPEEDGEYLITKKCFGWNCKEYYESDIAWYGRKGGWHKADEVIAWMPLPEPYREEGDE